MAGNMADNKLYLENLEEAIIDENKVVTYKWLCHHLNVRANVAKQMLFEFVNKRKEVDNNLNVTYMVAGIRDAGNKSNGNVHSVCVVPQSRLEAAKEEFTTLTSVHVYSVQRVPIADSNVLYAADCDASKAIDIRRASAINCDAVAHRSTISATPPVTGDMPVTKIGETAAVVQPAEIPAKKKTTKGPQGALNSMFAKMASRNEKNREKKLSTSDSPTEVSENAICLTNALKSNGDAESRDDAKSKLCHEDKVSKQLQKSRTNKEKGPEKSRDRKKAPKIKRKRIIQMSDSSDDDEQDCSPPVPDELENEEQAESPIPPLKVQNTTHSLNRKRKRKLVEETVQDDDGYIRTKKRWMECSDCESSSEENTSQTSPMDVKLKTEEMTKTKYVNQGPVKNKQATLTRFFKRK